MKSNKNDGINYLDALAFRIRNNKFLKGILKQPVILLRKYRTYPKAKELSERISYDILKCDALAFRIRNNKFLKGILKQPVILLRKYRTYPKAKELSERISYDILKCKEEQKNIWYFCAPAHENLGDLAQYICITKWIKENYSEYNIVEIPSMGILRFHQKIIKLLDKYIKNEDVFIFQSGYTMSDEHPDDRVRKLILNRYKNNRCLIFPQTILYKNNQKFIEMRNTLEKRKNLLLLARDKTTYEYAKEKFVTTDVLLYPDIVTSLIGSYSSNKNRSGIALCVRNDGEKYYSDEEILDLKDKLSIYENIEITDTECKEINSVNIENATINVMNKINKFSTYKIIVTDRYHGTIFSLIAGTPVIVIKTNDHKVSSGVNWFKGIYDDNVWYCDSLDAVVDKVKEIHNNHNYKELDAYFKTEYYDKLKEKFESYQQEK